MTDRPDLMELPIHALTHEQVMLRLYYLRGRVEALHEVTAAWEKSSDLRGKVVPPSGGLSAAALLQHIQALIRSDAAAWEEFGNELLTEYNKTVAAFEDIKNVRASGMSFAKH